MLVIECKKTGKPDKREWQENLDDYNRYRTAGNSIGIETMQLSSRVYNHTWV